MFTTVAAVTCGTFTSVPIFNSFIGQNTTAALETWERQIKRRGQAADLANVLEAS